MYIHFFRLTRYPFSIAPDPRFLFMSRRHDEALAHLIYGANSGGGVVVLSGEIGTGKTTVCRCFLEQVPPDCNVAYIFNPKLTVGELLQAICEEFHVAVPAQDSGGVKDYIDALNNYLLTAHAQGRNNVLIIDEAQNLSVEVLEQLRLLTNLETSERKLLQIILIGQPELRDLLARPELEQLAQRVIARYHLTALTEQETASYIQHRLSTSGLTAASPFQPSVAKQIHQLTKGVPRRINLLCDRALLGAYASGKLEVNRDIVATAGRELFGEDREKSKQASRRRYAALALAAGAMAAGTTAWTMSGGSLMHAKGRLGSALEDVFVPRHSADQGLKKAVRIEAASPAPAAAPALPSASSASAITAAAPVPVSVPASTPAPAPVSEPASEPAPAANAAAAASDAAASPEGTILPAPDSTNRAGLRNENDAIRQLARLWSIATPVGGDDPCDALQKENLRCYKSNSGLAELRQLDRPAIIRLRDQGGRAYYALLTGLSDSHAILRAGDTTQKVSVVDLTRYFRGEFILLWRAPRSFAESVKVDDRGPHVDWIASQLHKVYGGRKPESGQPFDQKMLNQVVEFQSAQGLFVDGVVGPVTLMHLNRVAGVEEPHLRGAKFNDLAKREE